MNPMNIPRHNRNNLLFSPDTNMNLTVKDLAAKNNLPRDYPTTPSPSTTPLETTINGSLLNIRSLTDPLKYNYVFDHLVNDKPDFFGLTETWLPHSAGSIGALCTPDNYSFFHHNPRPTGTRGGGVALICSSHLRPHKVNFDNYASFESMAIKLKNPSPSVLSVIYRSCSLPLTSFFDDITDYLSKISGLNLPTIIIGDFNLHVNKPTERDVSSLLDIFDIFNLRQFVHSPTHRCGNTLDLVISSSPVESITTVDSTISDHFLIKFKYTTTSSTTKILPPQKVNFRKLSNIDLSSLIKDLSSSLPPLEEAPLTPDALLNLLSSSLTSILDLHAPSITRSVKARPHSEFFNDDLLHKKRLRRSCERKFHKDKQRNINSDQSRENLKTATHSYFKALNLTRQDHTKSIVLNSKNKQQALFNLANKLLSPPPLFQNLRYRLILCLTFLSKKLMTFVLPYLIATLLKFFLLIYLQISLTSLIALLMRSWI